MDSKFFQDIYNRLEPVLPEKWEKVIFRADYTEGSYSMKFYVDFGDGVYVDCYSFSGISKSQLIKVFVTIDKVISPEREKLTKEKKWSVLTMIIDAKGDFKTEFDYSDISESSIEYQAKWEKKYLE